MADQPASATPTSGTPPATPPVAPAPTAAAPAPGTPPAPAAAAPAPKPPQRPTGNGGKFDEDRFDKNPKAMKRIRQLAAQKATALIQEKFPGMSLEEVAEKVRLADAALGAGGAPAAPAAAPGSDREKARLAARVTKLLARVAESKRKRMATKVRARDQVVELELRMDALRAGITDEQADFALWQYRKAAQNAADPESIPDSLPFFQGMRTTHPQIFHGAAALPVVPLRPTSAPPVSLQPGQETPAGAPAGAAPPQVDAFKMSDEQFRRHKASYGVR